MQQADELAGRGRAARGRARGRRHAVRRGVGRGRHHQHRARARPPALGVGPADRRRDRPRARADREQDLRPVPARGPPHHASSASRRCPTPRPASTARLVPSDAASDSDPAPPSRRTGATAARDRDRARRRRARPAHEVWAVRDLADGPVTVIGDDIGFALTRNTGSAFSLFQAFTPLLAVVAIVRGGAARARGAPHPRHRSWSSGCRSCSAARSGTCVDRLFRSPGFLKGAVVDFVHVGSFPTFNVADSAITIGAVLIVIWAVRTDLIERTTPTRALTPVAEEFAVPEALAGERRRPRGGAADRLDPQRGAGAGRGRLGARRRRAGGQEPAARGRRRDRGAGGAGGARASRGPIRRSRSSCGTRTPTSSVVAKPAGPGRAPRRRAPRRHAGERPAGALPGARRRRRPRAARASSTGSTATPAACWWWRARRPRTTRWWRCSPPTTSNAATSRSVWGTPDVGAGRDRRARSAGRCAARRAWRCARAGATARTAYEVVAAYRDPEVSLLECRLETGRTHQIRVHLQAIGHPVVGDAAYGGQPADAGARPPVPPRRGPGVRAPGHRGAGAGRGAARRPTCVDVLSRLVADAEGQSSASAPGGVVVTGVAAGVAVRRDRRPSRVEPPDGGVGLGQAEQPEVGAQAHGGRERGRSLTAPAVASSLRRCTRLVLVPRPYLREDGTSSAALSTDARRRVKSVVTHDPDRPEFSVKATAGSCRPHARVPSHRRVLSTMRVLIVEDDDAIARPLAKGLEREGLDGRPGRDRRRRARPQRDRCASTSCCSTSACPTATGSTCAASCAPAPTCRSSWSPRAPRRSTGWSGSSSAPTTTS